MFWLQAVYTVLREAGYRSTYPLPYRNLPLAKANNYYRPHIRRKSCAVWLQAVYTVLREAEYRSTYPLPYWNLPLAKSVVPRQRRCQQALRTINSTLDALIAKSKRVVGVSVGAPVEERSQTPGLLSCCPTCSHHQPHPKLLCL